MRAIAVTVILLVAGLLGVVLWQPVPAALPAPATGALVWRNGTFAMKLGDEPCPFEELDEALTERGVPPVKAYRELQRDGRWSMPGCWAKDMGGDVVTMDTAGGEGFVPIDWFNRDLQP